VVVEVAEDRGHLDRPGLQVAQPGIGNAPPQAVGLADGEAGPFVQGSGCGVLVDCSIPEPA
jgi:hypothetical protein